MEEKVQVGGGPGEFRKGEPLAAARCDEFIEVVVDGLHHLGEARSVAIEARAVVLAAAGEVRGDLGIGDLVLAARDHPHPRAVARFCVGVAGDVVVHDEVGLDAAQQLAQAVAH